MRTNRTPSLLLAVAALAGSALVAAAPAQAQVTDEAKAVLNESAKAVLETKGVTYNVKTYATSMLKDIIDLSGTVKVWRDAKSNTVTWMVEGRSKDPGHSDRKIVVTSDGTTTKWLDFTENKLFEAPATDPKAQEATGMCNELLLDVWKSPNPYQQVELQMPMLSKTGIDNINGEVCDVVEGLLSNKERNRTWWISVKDRLPRKLELGTGNMAQKIAKITEMTEVKPTNFTAKDFVIALPTGFQPMKIGAVVPQVPANPAEPLKPVEFGIKVGVAAPPIAAKDTAGKEIKFNTGTVTVLEFWGTMFKQSTSHVAEMKALASEYKRAPVQFVGVACRSDEKAATTWWNTSGPGYALVSNGDKAKADYKVMGVPSYVVIGTDGNVAAFFQDYPGADKLKTAIDQAMKK